MAVLNSGQNFGYAIREDGGESIEETDTQIILKSANGQSITINKASIAVLSRATVQVLKEMPSRSER